MAHPLPIPHLIRGLRPLAVSPFPQILDPLLICRDHSSTCTSEPAHCSGLNKTRWWRLSRVSVCSARSSLVRLPQREVLLTYVLLHVTAAVQPLYMQCSVQRSQTNGAKWRCDLYPVASDIHTTRCVTFDKLALMLNPVVQWPAISGGDFPPAFRLRVCLYVIHHELPYRIHSGYLPWAIHVQVVYVVAIAIRTPSTSDWDDWPFAKSTYRYVIIHSVTACVTAINQLEQFTFVCPSVTNQFHSHLLISV